MENSPTAASPELLAFASSDTISTTYPNAILAWKAHAANCYPEEACGIITKAGGFIPAKNVHEDPTRQFKVEDDFYEFYDEVAVFLHSHTVNVVGEDGKVQPVAHGPTKFDMQSQQETPFPWGISMCDGENTTDPICWGDQLTPRPLLGRQFVHGIWDCYSLVRDWHRMEKGIIIPDYPRSHLWWRKEDGYEGADMYEQFFKEAGFERVIRSTPLPGDCFICRLKSPVLNHAGVYIGDGMILHHPGGSLSQRSPAARWSSKMDFLVRHKDLPEE